MTRNINNFIQKSPKQICSVKKFSLLGFPFFLSQHKRNTQKQKKLQIVLSQKTKNQWTKQENNCTIQGNMKPIHFFIFKTWTLSKISSPTKSHFKFPFHLIYKNWKIFIKISTWTLKTFKFYILKNVSASQKKLASQTVKISVLGESFCQNFFISSCSCKTLLCEPTKSASSLAKTSKVRYGPSFVLFKASIKIKILQKFCWPLWYKATGTAMAREKKITSYRKEQKLDELADEQNARSPPELFKTLWKPVFSLYHLVPLSDHWCR